MLEALFQEGPLRKTAQGWWLRAGDVSRLTDVVRSIQKQFPRQVGQLSVMYRCLPDEHQDEAVLRSTLKTLRQQCKQIKSLTGFTLPVVVNAEFSGPETPWIIVRGDKPIVCPVNDSPQAFIDWQQAEDNILLLPTVSQAFSFIRNTLTDELEKPDRLTPPVRVFSVAMRLGVVNPEAQSVWSTWLCARTCLHFSRQPGQSVLATLFPDAVLPLLAPFASTVQGGQRTRRLVLLMWLCALTALGISALNNRDLIRQVSADLQRWNAIPMNHYRPKADSLAALKQDALLLERWQRQGEPLRYSLGYYPGQRLWLALQQAIDTWTPPPAPEPKPVPKIVRLDSMSLFDSGKSALKEGSTKILVNALVGIKAKPGWLIVVSGHTDNTGIRAGKGLFISADAQAKAQGEALDMDAALKEIDRLNQQLQQLEMAAEKAQALKADVDSQVQMFEQRLKPLNEALQFSAPEGMALTSGEDMQLTAGQNLVVNTGGDISVGTMGNLTTLAGEKLGLFARTGQLSVKSGEGPIDIQAQNASLRLFAEKKLTLSSASDISFAGKKRITLIGGGSYLRLEAGKVEYGTTASYLRKVKRTMFAGATNLPIESLKQMVMITQYYDRKLNFSSNVNYRVETMEGEEILSGSGADGYIDKKDSESEYWVFLS
ncbi:DUF2345 domain-containing protein [Enterobacter ludwigii]|uniref:DUF2345 domain-containing protein n=1 Tax=Enterobacter ludwigii TaxID=299767 RepID=UPI003975BAD3